LAIAKVLSFANSIALSSRASLEIPLIASFDALVAPFRRPPLFEVPCEGSVGVVLHEGSVGVVLFDLVCKVVVILLRNNAWLTGGVSYSRHNIMVMGVNCYRNII
jgi:hypothetical protein